ncbi:MAG: hypothetical protein LC754_09120 [Acidobacteria bacterium]|nr:hypothetical protein [Acidobacteriota bacterium]
MLPGFCAVANPNASQAAMNGSRLLNEAGRVTGASRLPKQSSFCSKKLNCV